jgi:hypothetical protein
MFENKVHKSTTKHKREHHTIKQPKIKDETVQETAIVHKVVKCNTSERCFTTEVAAHSIDQINTEAIHKLECRINVLKELQSYLKYQKSTENINSEFEENEMGMKDILTEQSFLYCCNSYNFIFII